jgi:alpha-amylase
MNSLPSPSKTKYLNVYFQVHQPNRLKRFQFFDIGSNASYFDDALNENILKRVAQNCYLPANKMLLKLIKKYPQIRITFSISGVALDQLSAYAPEVLESFRALAATGAVEFLGETYYHSLSFMVDKSEFITQVKQHQKKISEFFGVQPEIFRNTELIYSNGIGEVVHELGFKGMYLDGVESLLKGKTPNALYKHPTTDLILFPRNYALSYDIAFRYSDKNWCEYPLTPNKYVSWLKGLPADQNFIGLGLDYETFGEHKKAESGIFEFMQAVLSALANDKKFQFVSPSEAIKLLEPVGVVSTSKLISWADQERDLSAWLGGDLQADAFDSLTKMHSKILSTGNTKLISDYRYLQTSDHFYYMCTKTDCDGSVHQYFSPYGSPYEAFMNYMNVLGDLELKVKNEMEKQARSHWYEFVKRETTGVNKSIAAN